MPIDSYTSALERALLAAVMLVPAAARAAAALLRPGDLADPRHTLIWQAIRALLARPVDPDPAHVELELRKGGHLTEAGGRAYLDAILASSWSPEGTDALIADVRGLARRRAIEAGLARSLDRLRDPGESLPRILADAREAIARGSRDEPTELRPLGDDLPGLLALFDHPEQDRAVPTGIGPLDEALCGGMRPTELVILAAPPGGAKSALGGQIALRAAAAAPEAGGGPVLLMSFEMSRQEINLRLIHQMTRLRDRFRWPRGWLPEDRPAAIDAARRIATLPLIVDDTPPEAPDALRMRIDRHVAVAGVPALIVIDHLHLMGGARSGNRNEELTGITRSLKGIARELDVPVLALAQLSRDHAKREDHRPTLTDLRDSGSIEQAANIVIFPHHPSYHLPVQTRVVVEADGAPAEMILAKNRNGEPTVVPVTWLPSRLLHLPDPAWRSAMGQPDTWPACIDRPEIGGSVRVVAAALRPIPTPPALDEQVLEVLRANGVTAEPGCTRKELLAWLGVPTGGRWKDKAVASAVERLIAQGRLLVDTGTEYRYRLPAPVAAPRPVVAVDLPDEQEIEDLFGTGRAA